MELLQTQLHSYGHNVIPSSYKPIKMNNLRVSLRKEKLHDSDSVSAFNTTTAHGEPVLESACRLQVSRINRDSDVAALQNSLAALTQLYHTHPSMESVLKTASGLVVDILGLEYCSICWIDEEDLSIKVRTSHTRKGATVNPDQAVKAITDFVKRVRPNKSSHSQFTCGKDCNLESGGALELTSPLRVDKQIVGYLYALRNKTANKQFYDNVESLFITLSQNISAAIEVQQTREMLLCPYVELCLGAKKKESFSSLSPVNMHFLDSVKNPEKLVQKIARQFFRDLRRAGFDTKHILSVATEIIDNLNDVLRKVKVGRKTSHD